jgi:hypothetical protein
VETRQRAEGRRQKAEGRGQRAEGRREGAFVARKKDITVISADMISVGCPLSFVILTLLHCNLVSVGTG